MGIFSMKSKTILFILGLLLSIIGYSDQRNINALNLTNYLKQPTGQYGIGFEDFHWINQNACPDVNFSGKNQEDFSPGNTEHCHEIIARIYYPTTIQSEPSSPYYPPLIDSQIQQFKQQPSTSKTQFAYSDEVDHTFRRKWITDSDASGSLIPNDVDQSEQSDAYFNFTTKFPFCMIS